MTALRRLCRSKWALLRLAAALTLLALFLLDRPAHLARTSLAGLPDLDAPARIRDLREAGQFGDALLLADAAEAWSQGPTLAAVQAERAKTIEERDSWLRRAREVGLGALTGRGDSLERLVGAVTSDLFLVGDLRDLAVQSFNQATTGDSDEVVVLLSTAGVVTSLAPEFDWAPALMKAARKMGGLGQRLAETLTGALRERRWADARRILNPAAELAGATSPATAIRAMHAAESAEDLARLSAYAKSGKDAAATLAVGGRTAAGLVLAGEGGSSALRAAVRKGPAGFEFLAGAGRAALRPHALIGLAKGLWKGNVSALAQRAVERLAPHGWWLIPLLALWAAAEALRLHALLFPAKPAR
jgi:hypothetical protein